MPTKPWWQSVILWSILSLVAVELGKVFGAVQQWVATGDGNLFTLLTVLWPLIVAAIVAVRRIFTDNPTLTVTK